MIADSREIPAWPEDRDIEGMRRTAVMLRDEDPLAEKMATRLCEIVKHDRRLAITRAWTYGQGESFSPWYLGYPPGAGHRSAYVLMVRDSVSSAEVREIGGQLEISREEGNV